MTKKGLFIIVPSLLVEERKHLDLDSLWNTISMPIGVLSIIAYCNKQCKNVEFRVHDLREEYYFANDDKEARYVSGQYVQELIVENEPDYIFLSALFNTCYFHLDYIIDAIQNVNKSIPIILGGGYGTVQYKNILSKFRGIDAIIIAEGEKAIAAIMNENSLLSNVVKEHSSIVTREKLANGIEIQPEFLEDLDEIPRIDLKYINRDLYRKNSIVFNTSRGCPFNCVFCAAGILSGKKIRSYSVERIKEDFIYFYRQGYREITIFDENFLFYRERALEILDFFIEMNTNHDLKISFPGGVMVARIDDEIAYKFKQLGVKEISLALESGSEYVLKEIIKKPLALTDFFSAVNTLKNYDIDQRVFIVSGLPGETDDDRKKTVEVLKEAGITWAAINIAMPLVGSRLYDICIDRGYIAGEDTELNVLWGTASIKTEEYTEEYLKEAVYRMNLDVNFIHNYNFLNGRFEKVINIYEHIANAYENHLFAYWCLAKIYSALGNNMKADFYVNRYNYVIKHDSIWRKRAEFFGLEDEM